MNKSFLYASLNLLLLSLAVGCGRPPSSGGGPPPDFAVSAVVAPATPETVRPGLQVVGSLLAVASIDVVPEIAGTLEELFFAEGQTVQAGERLARLDATKLQARVAEAEARFRLADANLRRSQELLTRQTIARQEFDFAQAEFQVAEAALKLLRLELDDTEVSAPFAGRISERRVSPGQYVTVGQPLVRLVQMDPLEVAFHVPERNLPALKAGQRIALTVNSYPDLGVDGEVFFIDPVVDPQARTVLVKARIGNPDGLLQPGMFAVINLVLEERAQALVVPEAAVRYRGDQAYVVMVNEEQRVAFQDVSIGLRMPGKVEITSGLNAGDLVVVEGFQKMGPGTAIAVSPRSERYGVTPPEAQETP